MQITCDHDRVCSKLQSNGCSRCKSTTEREKHPSYFSKNVRVINSIEIDILKSIFKAFKCDY